MTARSRYYVQSVSELTDEKLRCHAFGHAWEPGPVSRLSPVGLEVWTITLHCGSCTKERTDQVQPGTYELFYRRYTRPDGFSVANGTGDRRSSQVEWLLRQAQRGKVID